VADPIVLSQSSLATALKLVLHDDRVEKKGDLLTSKVEVRIRDIAAILRDPEQVHILGPGDPISFQNTPGKAAFDYFMDQLVRRVVSST